MEKCGKNLMDFKVQDLLGLIMATIFSSVIPLTPIPSMLVLIGGKMRPGMSAKKISARILNKMSDAGIPVGPINGKDNLTSVMVESIVGEMTHSIKTESSAQVAIAPGAISFMGVGGNAGGPVTVNGMSTNIVSGDGIIS